MKLGVIGLGPCGGRIADEFARLQMRSHGLRGLDSIVEAVAVDTDFADLAGLQERHQAQFDHRGDLVREENIDHAFQQDLLR